MPAARDNRPTPNRIRQIRQERGLTLQQLSDKAGMHYTTLAKLERQQRGLKIGYLAAIANALGVTPRDLLGSDPDVLPVRMVPIIHEASVAHWEEAIGDPIGSVPAPVGSQNAFAVQVESIALDRIVAPGAYVVVDPDDFELQDQRIYAMKTVDGTVTFRRFHAAPPRLEPCSSDASHTTIALGREPFTTVGRVVWQGSEL